MPEATPSGSASPISGAAVDRVVVIGAGSWGTAVAMIASTNAPTTLWARRADLAAAIEHLTALTDQAPDFAEGWNARATAYFMAGEVGPSIADIQRALALNPRHFGALSGLGQIFEALDKPDLALRAYEAAFAVNPHMTSVKDAIDRLTREKQGTDL